MFLKMAENSDILEPLGKGIINDEINQEIEKIAAAVIAQLKDK